MGILDNVDASACPVRYVYGNGGKPFYIQGPNESASQSKKIVEKLQRACGEDGCHYLVAVGGHVF
jgi:hypothetical protein